MTNPDFVKLAEAMGCKALRCKTAEDLPRMMKEFLEYDGTKPIVMECEVTKNEHGESSLSFVLFSTTSVGVLRGW